MRRLRLGGVAAALVLGLGLAVATTRAGDYAEDGSPEPTGLLSGMFHDKPKNQAKNTKNAKNSSEAKPRPVASAESGSVELAAAEQQRRMNALIRRMEVCDRLRMIADQTGNEALMIQANELEDRANAIYRQQMAGLPMPAQTPLSILAGDQQNPGRVREGTVATAPLALPNGRGTDQIQSGPRPLGSGGMGGN